MWVYSKDSYNNCELFLLIMDSIQFTIFIDVALAISYQYFSSANNIFIFSQTGVLPGKRGQKRNRNLLILLAVLTFVLGTSYLFAIIYLNIKEEWRAYGTVTQVTEALGLGLQMVVCVLFGLTLNQLRRSRADASEPGQLNRRNIWLGLMILILSIAA